MQQRRSATQKSRRHLIHAGICLTIASAVNCAVAAPMLEEVLVTAQKRSQSTQDIPVAVTGLTAVSYTHLTLPTNREV